MATIAYEETDSGAPSEPLAVGTFWNSLLTWGGLLLVGGSLGFATVQMQVYEDRIAELEAAGFVAEAVPADTAGEETPAEPPSVVAGAATPADARIAELEAQIAQRDDELSGARANLNDAQGTIDDLTAELEACRGEIANPSVELRRLRDENSRLDQQVRQLEQRCAAVGRGEIIR